MIGSHHGVNIDGNPPVNPPGTDLPARSERSSNVLSRVAPPGALIAIAGERVRASRMLARAGVSSLRLTVELQPEQLAQIAPRVREILTAEQHGPVTASPYLAVAEAAENLVFPGR